MLVSPIICVGDYVADYFLYLVPIQDNEIMWLFLYLFTHWYANCMPYMALYGAYYVSIFSIEFTCHSVQLLFVMLHNAKILHIHTFVCGVYYIVLYFYLISWQSFILIVIF